MITKDQNTALITVGNAALKNINWTSYANYCFDREKGLRKEAFSHLDEFLKSTITWTTEQKIEFIKFLFHYFENVQDADYGAFPQPLSIKLVKPTLESWCTTETEDPRPFRWYGKYYRSEDHLLKVLKIDPLDDKARNTLLSRWTYNIYYSIHHLPDGYIGDPQEDLELANKIKKHIDLLTDIEERRSWTDKLNEDLELIKNYIEWKNSGHPNFQKWGQENKKSTNYGTTHYYYEK